MKAVQYVVFKKQTLYVIQLELVTLTLVVDLLGGDDFVDDRLQEVAFARHPGWETGDVQLPLVADGVIQR